MNATALVGIDDSQHRGDRHGETRVISVAVAEGPFLDRVLDARCQRSNNGLSSRASGVLHAA